MDLAPHTLLAFSPSTFWTTQYRRMTLLRVEGMSCGGCVGGIEKALKEVPGVENATVDLDKKLATIVGTAADAALIAAVESTGKKASVVQVALRRGTHALGLIRPGFRLSHLKVELLVLVLYRLSRERGTGELTIPRPKRYLWVTTIMLAH